MDEERQPVKMSAEAIQSLQSTVMATFRQDAGMRHWANRHGGEIFKELTKRPDKPDVGTSANGLVQCRQSGPRVVSQPKRKLMCYDPQINLGMKAVRAPVMASLAMPQVVTSDPMIEAYLHAALFPQLRRITQICLGALKYGYMPCEKIYRLADLNMMVTGPDRTVKNVRFNKAVVLHNLWDKDPTYWYPYTNEKTGEFAGIGRGGLVPSAGEWVPSMGSPNGPADKAFLCVNEQEFGELTGESMLDYIYEPWSWSVYVHMYCNRYFQNRAIPPIFCYAPEDIEDSATGTLVSGTQIAGNIASQLTGEGIGSMPNTLMDDGKGGKIDKRAWEMEFAKEDRRGDMFISYLDYLQVLKLRGLVIPERVLTQSTGYGTYAMALRHTETFETNETLILDQTLEHINRWIVEPLLVYNFGPNHAPATVSTVIKIADRRDLIARLLEAVITSESKTGPSKTAAIVDVVKAYELINFPTKPIGTGMEPLPKSTEDLAAVLQDLPQYRQLAEQFAGNREARLDSKPLQQAVYEVLKERHGNTGMVSKMADAATKHLLARMAA